MLQLHMYIYQPTKFLTFYYSPKNLTIYPSIKCLPYHLPSICTSIHQVPDITTSFYKPKFLTYQHQFFYPPSSPPITIHPSTQVLHLSPSIYPSTKFLKVTYHHTSINLSSSTPYNIHLSIYLPRSTPITLYLSIHQSNS